MPSTPMCSFSTHCAPANHQERRRKSQETRLKLARLPHRKGLEDIDSSFRPSIDKRQIDEVGHLQLDLQETELLCRLISERYEHGSIILTRNRYFSDNVLATALLNRLLHHAHVVNIRDQTYRLRNRLKAGAQTVPQTEIPAEI